MRTQSSTHELPTRALPTPSLLAVTTPSLCPPYPPSLVRTPARKGRTLKRRTNPVPAGVITELNRQTELLACVAGGGGRQLLAPSTFLEHATPAQLARHLHARSGAAPPSPIAAPALLAAGGALLSSTCTCAMGVGSCEGRLPGGVHGHAVAARAVECSADLAGRLALRRWLPLAGEPSAGDAGDEQPPQHGLHAHATPLHGGVLHGGVLEGAALFDAEAFGVSNTEAAAMDPQQRVLLEVGYAALRATGGKRSGLPREALEGSDTAVHIGLMSVDFAELDALRGV